MEAQNMVHLKEIHLSSIFQGYDFSRVNNAVWTSNEDPDMSGPDFLQVFVGEVYEEFPLKMPTRFPGWLKQL